MEMFSVRGMIYSGNLCDEDVRKLTDNAIALITSREYTVIGIRRVFEYLLILVKEVRKRFGENVDISEVENCMSSQIPLGDHTSPTVNIEVLDWDQYREKAAGYAEWKHTSVPRGWVRKECSGRLFCPLNFPLTAQTGIPMEKKEEKEEIPVGKIYKETADWMKSFGTKSFKRIDIEAMLINGEDIQKEAEKAVRNENDWFKAMQYVAEKKGVKLHLTKLRKAWKTGTELTFFEENGLEMVSFLREVNKPFNELGIGTNI